MDKLTFTAQQTQALRRGFRETFQNDAQRFFSAPGRTELCGNHTDHQRGRVLAAAVDLDIRAAVSINGTDTIRVLSEGYPLCQVQLGDLAIDPAQFGTTQSLIRGIAAEFSRLGCQVCGFDAYVMSDVLPGSGLSSSAAFEVLIGTIINCLFYGGQADPKQIAQIGQAAENKYFGKPCGLMDQMASSVGNMVTIDFFCREDPVVQPISFDFSACGHALCIIDSGANHADLTDAYAAIPGEMGAVDAHFGKEVLSQVREEDFYAAIPSLRQSCGDRAVLRAIHFYQENARVPRQVAALRQGDFDTFLALEKESGRSSYMYLQNVLTTGDPAHQALALTLALCEKLLHGRGAYRVHGGGFAGTAQAFVPLDLLSSFRKGIDSVLGEGACHVLTIRPLGGTEAYPTE